MEFTIDCKPRPEGSKPNTLRRSGQLPAVLYGHQGTESISLVIDSKTAEILLRDASINNSLIQVNIPDLSWKGKALLREVQTHPWKGTPYHISFFAVADHGSLEVDVPLHFVGTAKGIKEGGGSLDPSMNSLHVKCVAEQIPDFIEVDVTDLGVGDSITISQVNFPAGVLPTGDPDRVVAIVLSGGSKAGEEA